MSRTANEAATDLDAKPLDHRFARKFRRAKVACSIGAAKRDPGRRVMGGKERLVHCTKVGGVEAVRSPFAPEQADDI